MAYLKILSISRIVKQRMMEWLLNNELERTWNKAAVA
jgi:hypothetical protein